MTIYTVKSYETTSHSMMVDDDMVHWHQFQVTGDLLYASSIIIIHPGDQGALYSAAQYKPTSDLISHKRKHRM